MEKRKVSEEVVLAKLIKKRSDKVIDTFAKSILPMLLLLKLDIEYDENKNVPDIYLKEYGKNIVLAGQVPENYTNEEIVDAILYTLFMYMNLQIQRGYNVSNPNLWIDAVNKLNMDLFHIQNNIPKEFKKKDTYHLIDNYKNKKAKLYRYAEEFNYKILSENSNNLNNLNHILSQLNSIIQQLSQNPNNNSLTDALKNIYNSLSNDGYAKQQDIKTARVANKESNIPNKLKNRINNLLNEIEEKFSDKNQMLNWHKHRTDIKRDDMNRLSEDLQNLVRTNFEKLKGELSANAVEYLKKILRIEFDWTEILKRAINTRLEKAESRRWNYPNIYYMHLGYFPSEDYEEKTNNIAIFVDTSGSMSHRELKKIFGIILDLLLSNDVKSLTIIQHDYELTSYKIYDVEYLDIDTLTKNVKIHGRGGTSHVRPFEQFMKLVDDEILPFPDLVIFMSDFESDFERLIENNTFKRNGIEFFCITTYRKPDNVNNDDILRIED